eukprot:c27422_g1_i1 orf=601-1296(-)
MDGLFVFEGFIKSTTMTIVSEIGDKTFFLAALMAMQHPRKLVLAGALGALVVMTLLSTFFGWAAPNLISRKLTHNLATILFFGFGLRSLWDGFMEEDGDSSELAAVQSELADNEKKRKVASTNADDDLKKQGRQLLTQFFSPILLETFSLTFFGEWGDRSQVATIGLAAEESVVGVALGGFLGHAVCTIAAVWGGKHLASHISEKTVAFCGGIVFLIFGIHSLLAGINNHS